MRAARESTLDPTVSTSSARLDFSDHAPVLAGLRGQIGRDGHSGCDGLTDPPTTPADNELLDLSVEDGDYGERGAVAQEGDVAASDQRHQRRKAAGSVNSTVDPAWGTGEEAVLLDAALPDCDL